MHGERTEKFVTRFRYEEQIDRSLLCGLMSASFTAAKARFRRMAACAQGPSQMNSHVRDRPGTVVVLDGGTAADAPFARIRGRPGQTASINGSSPIRMWIIWGR